MLAMTTWWATTDELAYLQNGYVADLNDRDKRPGYKDLPAFDALRQLGPSVSARRTITFEEGILVLCSYGKDFFNSWKNIRRQLQRALSESGILASIVRQQDVEESTTRISIAIRPYSSFCWMHRGLDVFEPLHLL